MPQMVRMDTVTPIMIIIPICYLWGMAEFCPSCSVVDTVRHHARALSHSCWMTGCVLCLASCNCAGMSTVMSFDDTLMPAWEADNDESGKIRWLSLHFGFFFLPTVTNDQHHLLIWKMFVPEKHGTCEVSVIINLWLCTKWVLLYFHLFEMSKRHKKSEQFQK